MVKRGVKIQRGSAVYCQTCRQNIYHILAEGLGFIGSWFMSLADWIFKVLFIHQHRLVEKHFTIFFDQNWLTKTITEIRFQFKSPRPTKSVLDFLFGAIERTFPSSTIDIVYAIKAKKGSKGIGLDFKFLKLKDEKSFYGAISKSHCFDRACNDISFEVWEDDYPGAYLKFHFHAPASKEIAVTGSHSLLRRLFHHA